MATQTFLWHDYETFGSASRPWDWEGSVAPQRARPSQFGAIRTSLDLEEIGEPIEFYCKPSLEELPSIDACLTTGMSPYDTLENGLSERAFFERVLETFSPNTCAVGWNNFGYDDEVTRFGFWRNLMVPVYEREYSRQRSRWDLLPVFRLIRATYPGQFEWPTNDEGIVSTRLEELARENGIVDHDAHDALGDVRATISLARLVLERLPDLWKYTLSLRETQRATEIVDKANGPLFYSNYRLGAKNNYGTVVLPVARYRKEEIVVDLRFDPTELLELSAEDIHQRLFHRGEGEERLPLQKIKLNQSPMVAALGVLKTEAMWEHLELDRSVIEQRSELVGKHHGELSQKVTAVYSEPPSAVDKDAEEMLYGGNFPSDDEERVLRNARKAGTPAAWRGAMDALEDERLSELAFRMLAREHPEALDEHEQHRSSEYVRERFISPGVTEVSRVQETLKEIIARREDGKDPSVCENVERWVRELAQRIGVDVEGM